jgi:hypothetical protein
MNPLKTWICLTLGLLAPAYESGFNMSSQGAISQADTRRKRWIGLLFALFLIIVSINAPPHNELFDYVPFWGPFQKISDNNRVISCGLALGLIACCLFVRSAGSFIIWSPVATLLLVLNVLTFAKNSFSVGLLALAFLVGSLLLLIATSLVAKVMASRQTTDRGTWWPLVLASLGFLVANLVQYRINPTATMQVSNRFHGITSNPQMYALTVAIMVPSLLFQYTQDRRKVSRLAVLFAFLLLLFFALISGSRLSLLLTAVSLLMYYRAKIIKLAAFAIPAVLLLTLWLLCNEQLPMASNSHITSLQDTRSQIWQIQLETICNYPLFGKPLDSGERAGFGENSFLAAGATLGLTGLLLMLAVGFLLVQKILALMRLEARVGWCADIALPIAVLSSCVVGAFFEAFLLGIFTFPLTSLLYNVFMSEEMLKRISHRSAPRSQRHRLTLEGPDSLPRIHFLPKKGTLNQTVPHKPWMRSRKRWPNNINCQTKI